MAAERQNVFIALDAEAGDKCPCDAQGILKLIDGWLVCSADANHRRRAKESGFAKAS